ncbi:MAG: hypothetical protein CMM60_14015 [Rhodospirillaceae bacterium]|jgi:nucleoside-diphosphate-sugar epimerase|nr:hypothetical protein [Rhodospirillaceae bacterium]|tara:strand:- start:8904 stop:9806 length:903 start_codon:yes stop_codon:yes gene_type:complete
MNILVTGATGFLGRHVLCALEESGHRLGLLMRSPSRRENPTDSNQHEIIDCDLDNYEDCKTALCTFAPEMCIHLAWEGIPDYSPKISKRNLLRSCALIDILVSDTPCRRILISGSCFEYGKVQGECREEEPVTCKSYFGWAKNALYEYALLACANSSMSLTWFRVFYVYGMGQRPGSLIPSLLHAAANGEHPNIMNPNNANDFIHAKDVARAFALAVKHEHRPGIYNLGTGRATPVIDICRVVERLTKFEGFTDSLASVMGSSSSVNFWANIDKAEKELGWTPEISLEQGVMSVFNEDPT